MTNSWSAWSCWSSRELFLIWLPPINLVFWVTLLAAILLNCTEERPLLDGLPPSAVLPKKFVSFYLSFTERRAASFSSFSRFYWSRRSWACFKLLLTFFFVHFSRFQVTCAFPPSQVFLSPLRSLFRCALSLLPLLSAASQALSNVPFPVSLARAIAPFLTSQLRWRLPFLFLSWDVPFPFPPFLLKLPNVQAPPTFFFPLPSGEREPP